MDRDRDRDNEVKVVKVRLPRLTLCGLLRGLDKTFDAEARGGG